MWITDWTTRAACKGTDPDELFVQGAAQNRAKLICAGCRVRTECLADALDNRIEFGVWGGMSEAERRDLLCAPPPPADDGRRKTCCRCGDSKPLDAFYRRKDAPDGRQSRCKHCEERDRMSPV